MDRLTALEVFVAIVEYNGFARAARVLRMSPAMVSTHMTRLEERLGAPLLNRTTRRIELTQQGLQFLEETRHVLAALAAAETSVQHGGVPAGRVRIDAPASLGLKFIIPAIPAFRRAYPKIVLDLSLGDRGTIFRSEGFDIIIRVGEVPSTDAVTQKLGQTRFVQVVAPDYLARHPMPTAPEDLLHHSCIAYASSYALEESRWRFRKGGEMRWLKPPGMALFNHGEAIRDAAILGVGIAQTLEMLVADALAEGKLTRVLDDWNQDPVPVYQLSPQGRYERTAVQAVWRFLASAIDWVSHGPNR